MKDREIVALFWKRSPQALEALEALGYSKAEASQALGRVYDETKTVQQLLKEALRQLAAF